MVYFEHVEFGTMNPKFLIDLHITYYQHIYLILILLF